MLGEHALWPCVVLSTIGVVAIIAALVALIDKMAREARGKE